MDNNANQLYHGDNLSILREMPDGCIDLIATDPPFNTGKDWGAFNDKWEGGMKGYLKFMEPRLEEMHRLLKDTGSIYLHCGYNVSHYLKVMMDGIFGIKHFRNEIVWCYTSPVQTSKCYPRKHDIILFPPVRFSLQNSEISEAERNQFADAYSYRSGKFRTAASD